MYMTIQKGTGFFITAILLTSSLMHFPHQVYSVQIFSSSKTKHGVCIKLKNSFPTVFAFFAPTIFKHDRNLKTEKPLIIYLFMMEKEFMIILLSKVKSNCLEKSYRSSQEQCIMVKYLSFFNPNNSSPGWIAAGHPRSCCLEMLGNIKYLDCKNYCAIMVYIKR